MAKKDAPSATGRLPFAVFLRRHLWWQVAVVSIVVTASAAIVVRNERTAQISKLPYPSFFVAELLAEAGSVKGEFDISDHVEFLILLKDAIEDSGNGCELVQSDVVPVIERSIANLRNAESAPTQQVFVEVAVELDRNLMGIYDRYYRPTDKKCAFSKTFESKLELQIEKASAEYDRALDQLIDALGIRLLTERLPAGDDEQIYDQIKFAVGEKLKDDEQFRNVRKLDQDCCIASRKLLTRIYVAQNGHATFLGKVDIAALKEKQELLVRIADVVASVTPSDDIARVALDTYVLNDRRRSQILRAMANQDEKLIQSIIGKAIVALTPAKPSRS